MSVNFNLKEMRERKGFSQQELASALNAKWILSHPNDANHFTVDMVVRMEKAPDNISLDALMTIIQVFGVTFDQLLNPIIPRLEAPTVKNNWGCVENLRKHIEVYMENKTPEYLKKEYPEILALFNEIKERATRKPKIACIGRPDSGKSRTLNTLIGNDVLPTNWTPTTSTIVYLKHLADKPAYFGSDNVWIFKDEESEAWNPDKINDESYCRKWQIAAGDYSLIAKYGAHNDSGEEDDIGAVVAFIDSPILYNCDLIDLPGFNPQSIIDKGEEAQAKDIYDSKDSMLSARGVEQADAYIYLSIANSFLYGDDLAMAQSIVKSLPAIEKKGENEIPPLGNLFYVASQALAVNHGDVDKLNAICDEAANRVWGMIHNHPSITKRKEQTGYSYDEKVLRERFFTSEMDSQTLTQRFYSELIAFIEMLPLVQESKARKDLASFCESQRDFFQKSMEQNRRILENHEVVQKELKEMEENEPKRAAEFRSKVYQMTDTINNMKRDSAKKCAEIYNAVINPLNIVNIIEKRGFKKNKKDMQELVTILSTELENRVTSVLVNQSEELNKEIDDFLKSCQTCFDWSDRPDVDKISFIFDVKRAFVGGLSGAAVFGAFAAWAATCGNLGGYILVAKAVSFLASIGIHLGGTAAVISAVAAIGGPVTLGISIALIASIATILALGGTWKKQIGNKLVKLYDKKGVLKNLIKATDGFWDNTLTAFRTGAEQIEADWQKYMKELKEKVENFDAKKLESDICNTKKAIDFFGFKGASDIS